MKIHLEKMTRTLMRNFYKEFAYDSDTFSDGTVQNAYIYDEESVDAVFDKHNKAGKIHFAVMLGQEVVGDVYLKHFDNSAKTCTLGIHLKNDSVKNKGYGTQSEILALEYAFNELEMETVFADALVKNTRSRHVLEKAGFVEMRSDGQYSYYRCDRTSWKC